jgi:acetyl esterase/lipase
MNNLRLAVIFLTLCSCIPFTNSQDYTLKVWPELIPGAIENPNYEMEIIYRKDSTPRFTKVTDPKLEVYLATENNATGAAVVICPGGGYSALAIDHEGRDVAAWLNKHGITGIVLSYRLPSDEIMEDKSVGPLQDVQEAIRIVRRQSEEWNLDTERIGVLGFSAGGHLASTASTHYNDKVYNSDETSARPDFSILIYPVISMDPAIYHGGSNSKLLGKDPDPEKVIHFSNETQVGPDTPPAFLVHSLDDRGVNPENSIRYGKALNENNVPAELHLFEGCGHGYCLGKSKGTESTCPVSCIKWLIMNEFLK